MPAYLKLDSLLRPIGPADSISDQVLSYLAETWLEDYCASVKEPDIVGVTLDSFSYLFDVAQGRLIAAWGISSGRHGADRDRSRMAGHPLSSGPLYHRGHTIPHRLGGGTDINLVDQLGSVNIGAFRQLENRAVATPGALYFTYWKYDHSDSQKPSAVEQGLLIPGQLKDIRLHVN
ncbi:DNA/RNA non-specific endonuclease [Larkinella soli]|uniref:DNA/RNA non-specific endonuclease n=1 Tax=Larkinella soli TaxID=1770527 RepID=UPI000FFC0EBA|nr:hypothetical protein [Larkinella soli]